MPKLRNRVSGVVVSVADELAAQLNSYEWEPADKAKRPTSSSEK